MCIFLEIRKIIEEGKQQVAQAVNVGLSATYWHIGKRINEDILENKRADYGKQVVATLGKQLTAEYGGGFSSKNLRHMMRFAEVFPDKQIVSSMIRQLSWTHFTQYLPKELLTQKLHQFTVKAKQLIKNSG